MKTTTIFVVVCFALITIGGVCAGAGTAITYAFYHRKPTKEVAETDKQPEAAQNTITQTTQPTKQTEQAVIPIAPQSPGKPVAVTPAAHPGVADVGDLFTARRQCGVAYETILRSKNKTTLQCDEAIKSLWDSYTSAWPGDYHFRKSEQANFSNDPEIKDRQGRPIQGVAEVLDVEVLTGTVPSIYSDGSRIQIQMAWKTFPHGTTLTIQMIAKKADWPKPPSKHDTIMFRAKVLGTGGCGWPSPFVFGGADHRFYGLPGWNPLSDGLPGFPSRPPIPADADPPSDEIWLTDGVPAK